MHMISSVISCYIHCSLHRLGDVNLQLCYSNIFPEIRITKPHRNSKSISVSCLLHIQISPAKIWKVWVIAASAGRGASLSTPQNLLCEPAILDGITKITSVTVVKLAKFTWCSITRSSGTRTIGYGHLISNSSGISPQEVLIARISI